MSAIYRAARAAGQPRILPVARRIDLSKVDLATIWQATSR